MAARRTDVIDRMHDWFFVRRTAWSLVSVSCLGALICLWVACAYLGPISVLIRPAGTIFAGPLLIGFVLGIFWRGSIPSFLTVAGAASAYLSFYIYARFGNLHSLPPIVTNKLGVGKLVSAGPPDSLAELYFISAIFAFSFALVISYKPSIFRARGSRTENTYPLWTNSTDQKTALGGSIILVPLQGLLSYAERHLSARYAYLVVLIGGKQFFVQPNDWVPQGSFVLRDRRSGSLLGIPKVPDGFNVW